MAIIKKLVLCLIIAYAVVGCHTSHTDGYTRHPDGYYYKLLALGDGTSKPGEQNMLACNVVLKTQDDSIFFDTRHSTVTSFYISLTSLSNAGGKSYLLKAVAGDSISMMIKTAVFFREYFDTLTPQFCLYDSLIKINLKIDRIISSKEYEGLTTTWLNSRQKDTELEELKLVDNYLRKMNKNTRPNKYGIYILSHTITGLDRVVSGKRIRVEYSGFFLDGKPIDNGSQILEFAYGTPDQLVKGLNIVIGNLKKGETTKIIVPSRLAFGELGSSNGSIPPYTPLVYNVKLIDIK